MVLETKLKNRAVVKGGKGTKVWAKLREATGMSDVRLRDLRHSFASIGVSSGTPLMVIGALLGHADHATK